MRLREWFLLRIVLILFAGMGSSLLFGGTTGKIAGRVIDGETKEPLYGANIIVEGTMYGAAADIEGKFIILRIPPGVYTVRATMMGY